MWYGNRVVFKPITLPFNQVIHVFSVSHQTGCPVPALIQPASSRLENSRNSDSALLAKLSAERMDPSSSEKFQDDASRLFAVPRVVSEQITSFLATGEVEYLAQADILAKFVPRHPTRTAGQETEHIVHGGAAVVAAGLVNAAPQYFGCGNDSPRGARGEARGTAAFPVRIDLDSEDEDEDEEDEDEEDEDEGEDEGSLEGVEMGAKSQGNNLFENEVQHHGQGKPGGQVEGG
jgi:hypothetical protein